MWVEKVVTFRELSLSSSWWYPLLISRWENTVDPLSSLTTSSIVGCWVCLRGIAWFATRMSTFRRIWLWSFLGVTTGGDTHPVGSLTFSMMSWSIRCFISSSIFWRTLNGFRRGGWLSSNRLAYFEKWAYTVSGSFRTSNSGNCIQCLPPFHFYLVANLMSSLHRIVSQSIRKATPRVR